jgi:hypothetical protein
VENKYSEKNVNKVIEPCNEWCCPCNEGLGCQGNMFCRNACENAFFNDNDEWNVLMYNAFVTLNTPEYDDACKAIYDYAERL